MVPSNARTYMYVRTLAYSYVRTYCTVVARIYVRIRDVDAYACIHAICCTRARTWAGLYSQVTRFLKKYVHAKTTSHIKRVLPSL